MAKSLLKDDGKKTVLLVDLRNYTSCSCPRVCAPLAVCP